ncbi:hypothetical protein LT85_1591 [Collimonas arenae]|uniref:Uncharacterized protein n=1 Tax=Collimonas arenae TaxID=279058 RepID=A0A0A1FAT9_9BURK|nr:hypothetical protein LT85_1591 [Collimonas arenae]
MLPRSASKNHPLLLLRRYAANAHFHFGLQNRNQSTYQKNSLNNFH